MRVSTRVPTGHGRLRARHIKLRAGRGCLCLARAPQAAHDAASMAARARAHGAMGSRRTSPLPHVHPCWWGVHHADAQQAGVRARAPHTSARPAAPPHALPGAAPRCLFFPLAAAAPGAGMPPRPHLRRSARWGGGWVVRRAPRQPCGARGVCQPAGAAPAVLAGGWAAGNLMAVARLQEMRSGGD